VVGQQIIQGITRNIAKVGNWLMLEICEKTLRRYLLVLGRLGKQAAYYIPSGFSIELKA